MSIDKTGIFEKLELDRDSPGLIRRAVGWLVPVLDKYDSGLEARILRQDEDIVPLELKRIEVREYLNDSYQKHRGLYLGARVLDTLDRYGSMVGVFAETMGLSAGLIPGVMSNLIEESIDMAVKGVYYLELVRRGYTEEAAMVARKEFMNSLLPIWSDIYDAGTNLYVDSAKRIIRGYAKHEILRAHHKSA